MSDNLVNPTANDAAAIALRIENVLVKNVSLEIPSQSVAPNFKEEPTIKMEMRNSSRALSRDNYYEVLLDTVVRLHSGEELQLLAETTYAGIIYLENADAQQREEILNINVPEILYPYSSQMTTDLMARAGAPRVFLPPFNFRALYQKRKQAINEKLAAESRDGAAS